MRSVTEGTFFIVIWKLTLTEQTGHPQQLDPKSRTQNRQKPQLFPLLAQTRWGRADYDGFSWPREYCTLCSVLL